MTILPVGDYLLGSSVVVERKAVADLHRSLANGRLWSQVAALKRVSRPLLLVEGASIDRGPVSAAGIRGALLQLLDEGIPVIRSSCPRDSAVWLRLLAKRAARRWRDGQAPRPGRRTSVVSPVGLLATVPGLSPTIARRLLDRFGTVAAVAAASPSELEQVAGVGPGRAASLHRLLHC
jgi:ERCC4-type nuclease